MRRRLGQSKSLDSPRYTTTVPHYPTPLSCVAAGVACGAGKIHITGDSLALRPLTPTAAQGRVTSPWCGGETGGGGGVPRANTQSGG